MEKRIFFHDTDAGGIVYYGHYLKYLEEARTEFLEDRGLSVTLFRDRGLLYAVSRCSVVYRSPARYGDILICDASLQKATAVKLVFTQTIRQKTTGTLVCEAEVTLVCLDRDFKPTPIPEELKARLLK